MKITGTQ